MKTDNELIAEFIGWRRTERGGYMVPNLYSVASPEYSTGETEFDEHEFEFDTQWNWLMPVVEKIENIKHIGIDAVYLQINGRKCQIWTYFDVKEFLRLTGDDNNDSNKFKVGHSAKTKIDATYHAVVDFIKWYNSQKK